MRFNPKGWWLPVFVVAVLALSAVFWWPYTIDDTYITLRYAHNLASGHGPVFNIGERVEGYSCPIWVFGLGCIEWMGGNAEVAAKAIGFLCAIGLVLLLDTVLQRALQDYRHRRLLSSLMTLWFILVPGVHVYFCSGMETIPFALAAAFCVSIPVWVSSNAKKAWLMPLGVLAVATLRPEGMLLGALFGLIWFISERSRSVRLGLCLAGIAVFGLLLLRRQYYGSWLPNTYFAKPSPLALPIEGLSTLRRILYEFDRLFSYDTFRSAVDRLGGFGLLFCVFLACAERIRDRGVWTAAAAVLVGVVFLFYAPTDWMPAARFALPFVFPLFFLAGIGIRVLCGFFSQGLHRRPIAILALSAGCWFLFMARDIVSLVREYSNGSVNAALDGRKYAEIGKWLKENGADGDRVLAYEIGAVGYFSDMEVVDHEGLVTPAVSKIIRSAGGYVNVRWNINPDAMNQVVRYCVDLKPEWFLVRSTTAVPLKAGEPVPQGIADEPIQDAMLDGLHDAMVLAEKFIVRPAFGGANNMYLLLRRTRNADS